MGFSLQCLARAANLTLFQEHFYQPGRSGGLARGIAVMSGSLREVVRSICLTWNYRFIRSGNVYYFWSYNWALSRHADLPEPEIEAWRETLRRQGEFTLEDRIRMAARYSQPQLSSTVRVALRQAGRWGRKITLALRLLAAAPPWLRSSLEREPGVPVELLQEGELGARLREWLTPPDSDDGGPPDVQGGHLAIVQRAFGPAEVRRFLAVRVEEAQIGTTPLTLTAPSVPLPEHGAGYSDIDP